MKILLKVVLCVLLLLSFACQLYAWRITENLTGWTFGVNQPQLDSGARGDGGIGNYHYLPVGTNAYYYEASTAGEGTITFWIYDPGKCMSSVDPGYGYRGPQWGLKTPSNQAMCVGISRESFVQGCLGYKPWSTIAPNNPFWFYNGVRGSYGYPFNPGWYKWTITGTLNDISFIVYNVIDCSEPLPCTTDVSQIYDATSHAGIWSGIFGLGWNGFWVKGDNTWGIEDISVDIISGTGVFSSFGTDPVYQPYKSSTWGNIKALFR